MKRLLLFLLLLPLVQAATISGTIYDLELNEVEVVVLEIDTQPVQRIVVKDGTYSVEVPPGEYELYAHYQGMSTKENVIIKDGGEYHLDLFLYPDLSEDEALLASDPALEEDLSGFRYVPTSIILLIAALAVIIAVVVVLQKRKKPLKKEQEVSDNIVLDVLKKNDGRMTQKELRKHIPLSEAKVSLMVTELEAQGKVKKIKKGRSNILILH